MTAVATPDVGAAVQALQPRLRRQSLVAIAAMTLVGFVTLVAAVWATGIDADDEWDRWKVVLFIVLIGGLVMAGIVKELRKRQESLVMPIIAEAVGLSYEKNAKEFLRSLPDRLLPGQSIKRAEDYVTGQLGNHHIRMAEVEVETGGKNSRTLFKGVVAQLTNRVAVPAFFLAPHEQTKPGLIFGAWMPTDGLYHLRDVTSPSGEVFGLWTSWSDQKEPAALAAVVKVLTDLENVAGPEVSLFSATTNGVEVHLALSHGRDLYRVGGLFPEPAKLFGDVHQATRDFTLVLTIAQQLIAAEALVASTGAKAG